MDASQLAHHPHPHVRAAMRLRERALAHYSAHKEKYGQAGSFALQGLVGLGAAGVAAVADHYSGGTMFIPGTQIPAVGAAGAAAFGAGVYGALNGKPWAPYAGAAGLVWMGIGGYDWVKNMLQGSAGGQ